MKNMTYACDRNLLRYTPAKNYQSRPCFDKVIAKIKWCSCFGLTWQYTKR